MQKKIKNFLLIFIFIVIFLFLAAIVYFFAGSVKPAENITWGMNFSQKQAQYLGLDWKENYKALIDDMGVKKLKIASYWDLLEPRKGEYFFDDLDWQIKEAENKNIKIILVIGAKTPRWPECHLPDWAKELKEQEKQERILNLLKQIVLRYQSSKSISAWQVENEPFFVFGECWSISKNFLREEIDQVKSLDIFNRSVIISDSGEGSMWFDVADLGDIVGTTMYKKVWFTAPGLVKKYLNWIEEPGFYLSYYFPPVFYQRRAQIIEKLYGKQVICVELQAEPWGPKLLYDMPIEEQEKTMNLEQFKKNIEFAKNTGLEEFYLWGGEWIYWMKEKQNNPEIWNEAKKLFSQINADQS